MKRTAAGPIRTDLIDHVFRFGMAGDRAIAGDFNGDGIATIGVFRAGNWYLDVDGNGRWSDNDQFIPYGNKDDIPVVGDFNGDGIDEIGVWRAGEWLIDSNGNHEIDAQDKVFELGEQGDIPLQATSMATASTSRLSIVIHCLCSTPITKTLPQ